MDTTLLEQDAFARLVSLDALGAIRAWLDDDYAYGEDRVLVQAIRRETGIALGDREIWQVLSAAQTDDSSPLITLEHLLAADAGAGARADKPR
jgi:hypothetical protein